MALLIPEKMLFLVGLVTLTFNYLHAADAIKKTQDDPHGQLPFINKVSSNKVCCEIINEAEIDMKFFAELCKSVIEREMSTEAGIRMYRREEKYPPPGMMERCRKSIFEECRIDIREALIENKAQKMALQNDTNKQSNKFQINITDCIVNLVSRKLTVTPRKIKEFILPSYIHQERPLFLGAPPENLALKEKGSPYSLTNIFKDNKILFEKGNPKTAVLSYVKEDKEFGKAKFFILEPIYKLSATIFFIFAMTKFLTKNPQDTVKPKIAENNHVHKNGNGYRESISNGKLHSKVSFDKEDEEIPSLIIMESEAADDMQTAYEDLTEHCDEIAEDKSTSSQCDLNQTSSMAESQKMFTSLANYLKNLIQTDDAKIAVLGMEVQAEFPEKLTAKKQEEPELVTDVVEDGPSESTDEAVVVTGRMLISLLGKKKEGEFQQLAEHQMFTSVNTDG